MKTQKFPLTSLSCIFVFFSLSLYLFLSIAVFFWLFSLFYTMLFLVIVSRSLPYSLKFWLLSLSLSLFLSPCRFFDYFNSVYLFFLLYVVFSYSFYLSFYSLLFLVILSISLSTPIFSYCLFLPVVFGYSHSIFLTLCSNVVSCYSLSI